MAEYISLEKALSKVKSGDYIVTGLGAAEGREFMTKLHTVADKIKKTVTVSNCLPMGDYEFFSNPAYKGKFMCESWFYTPSLRKAHANGMVSFVPNHLHLAATKRLAFAKPNIYVGLATPPDKHGYVSLSLSNTYERRMIDNADLVILEVNPNAPRTFGDVQVHESEVDYFVKVDYPIPELPDAEQIGRAHV